METWNYNMPAKYAETVNQSDWNQTLQTMFNQLSKESQEPVVVKIPNKLKPLIETLAFYSENSIGEKYICEFSDIDTKIIEVGNSSLEILNY